VWPSIGVRCSAFNHWHSASGTDDGSLLVAPRSLRPRIISKPLKWKWSLRGQQRCLVVRELGRDWKGRGDSGEARVCHARCELPVERKDMAARPGPPSGPGPSSAMAGGPPLSMEQEMDELVR
jgi:hypothetical protein